MFLQPKQGRTEQRPSTRRAAPEQACCRGLLLARSCLKAEIPICTLTQINSVLQHRLLCWRNEPRMRRQPVQSTHTASRKESQSVQYERCRCRPPAKVCRTRALSEDCHCQGPAPLLPRFCLLVSTRAFSERQTVPIRALLFRGGIRKQLRTAQRHSSVNPDAWLMLLVLGTLDTIPIGELADRSLFT